MNNFIRRVTNILLAFLAIAGGYNLVVALSSPGRFPELLTQGSVMLVLGAAGLFFLHRASKAPADSLKATNTGKKKIYHILLFCSVLFTLSPLILSFICSLSGGGNECSGLSILGVVTVPIGMIGMVVFGFIASR